MGDKGLSAPDWGVCVHCCVADDPWCATTRSRHNTQAHQPRDSLRQHRRQGNEQRARCDQAEDDGPGGGVGKVHRPANAEALGQKQARVIAIEVEDAELPMLVVIPEQRGLPPHATEHARAPLPVHKRQDDHAHEHWNAADGKEGTCLGKSQKARCRERKQNARGGIGEDARYEHKDALRTSEQAKGECRGGGRGRIDRAF